jgi:hypothetical protein
MDHLLSRENRSERIRVFAKEENVRELVTLTVLEDFCLVLRDPMGFFSRKKMIFEKWIYCSKVKEKRAYGECLGTRSR